jgi:hypothetical protein
MALDRWPEIVLAGALVGAVVVIVAVVAAIWLLARESWRGAAVCGMGHTRFTLVTRQEFSPIKPDNKYHCDGVSCSCLRRAICTM